MCNIRWSMTLSKCEFFGNYKHVDLLCENYTEQDSSGTKPTGGIMVQKKQTNKPKNPLNWNGKGRVKWAQMRML